MTLAPDRSGSNTLTVRTRFLDGSFSPSRTYTFEVSDAPVVTCSDYPENNAAGQPGQPGRFSGVATATYTPTSASSHTMRVRGLGQWGMDGHCELLLPGRLLLNRR